MYKYILLIEKQKTKKKKHWISHRKACNIYKENEVNFDVMLSTLKFFWGEN